MIRPNGQHTDRSRAIAEVARTLKKYQQIITTAKTPTQVAVLYDPDNSSLLFAMELDDALYGRAHTGYYRAIWRSDLTARYVTHETLEDVTESVLIVPMALTMTDEIAERLAKYVRQGGVLIAEARTGLFDERGFIRSELPAGGLRQAAGLTEGAAVCSDPDYELIVPTADGRIIGKARTDAPALDHIQKGPTINFDWPIAAAVPVHGFLAPLELDSAQCIGRYEDTVLATRHDYGHGCMYYFGTYMGLALDKNISDAHDIIQQILLKHTNPVLRGQRLRPRLIHGKEKSLLVVFNDNPTETIHEAIKLPDGLGKATDIVTEQSHPLTGGHLQLTIEAEDAAVFLLEKTS